MVYSSSRLKSIRSCGKRIVFENARIVENTNTMTESGDSIIYEWSFHCLKHKYMLLAKCCQNQTVLPFCISITIHWALWRFHVFDRNRTKISGQFHFNLFTNKNQNSSSSVKIIAFSTIRTYC